MEIEGEQGNFLVALTLGSKKKDLNSLTNAERMTKNGSDGERPSNDSPGVRGEREIET